MLLQSNSDKDARARRDDEYEGKRERTIMKTRSVSANMECTVQSLIDGVDSIEFAVMMERALVCNEGDKEHRKCVPLRVEGRLQGDMR